jgi:hypothetical protein
MMNVITKTRIEPFKEEFCPHCEAPIENVALDDGETITLDPHPANVDAALIWGHCEICLNGVYMMDLAIIPEQEPGSFFNDRCWKAQSCELYSVNLPGYEGTISLAEYRDVHGVMITGRNGGEIYNVAVSSLKNFESPLWAADDLGAAFDRARVMAETIVKFPIER